MQKDFHYFATYCAAYLGGYSHEESVALCTFCQMIYAIKYLRGEHEDLVDPNKGEGGGADE